MCNSKASIHFDIRTLVEMRPIFNSLLVYPCTIRYPHDPVLRDLLKRENSFSLVGLIEIRNRIDSTQESNK